MNKFFIGWQALQSRVFAKTQERFYLLMIIALILLQAWIEQPY
jgi:hypothetical protein